MTTTNILIVTEEKEWLVLGVLNAGMRNGPLTERSRKKPTVRQRPRCTYRVLNRKVCKDAFLYLHWCVLFTNL
jgi:hypothetical protein